MMQTAVSGQRFVVGEGEKRAPAEVLTLEVLSHCSDRAYQAAGPWYADLLYLSVLDHLIVK